MSESRRTLLAGARPFSREWLISHFWILGGAVLLAGGYNLFIIPHQVVPGGMVGVAQLVNHMTGWPIGVMALAINLPAVCTAGVDCSFVQMGLAAVPMLISPTCAAGTPDGCDCSATVNVDYSQTDTYTAAGNTITTSDGRTYDYCVDGDTLTYTETTDSVDADPGIAELTRM